MLQLPNSAIAPINHSAVSIINKNIQPVADSPAPDLDDELNRLAGANDVGGLIVLYEYFVRLADANLGVINQPRAAGVEEFLSAESGHFWAKAYAVADRLKELKPDSYNRERYAQTLFTAALQMGSSLASATAVVQHINEI